MISRPAPLSLLPMTFHHQLLRIRRLLCVGRLIAAGTACLATACSLALILTWVDAAAALEPIQRTMLVGSSLAVLTGFSLLVLIRASRVPLQLAARHADSLLNNPRHPITAGLSLGEVTPSQTANPTLADWLAERTLESGAAAMATLPARRIIAWRNSARPAQMLLAVSAIAALLATLFPAAALTLAQRLFHPSADIPPFSRFHFAIPPATPATTYGGDIALSAEITGASASRSVECLVRLNRTGEILRLPAFRESPSRFSRKLEHLTEPVSVAFAIGRARSHWHPVDIRLQPEILRASVQITPPQHTGLQPQSFPLDSNEITAIEGSSVSLSLSSNRPLSGGTLTLSPSSSATRSSSATQPTCTEALLPNQASHSVSFTFTATDSASLSASVRDVIGTAAAKPLSLSLRVTPDQAPSVSLLSPPPILLATPSSTIPIQARADDDFSLGKILLVRTLAGFRDRTRVVHPNIRATSYELNESLDLNALGVEPGDTIELLVEATDLNPSLLGQGGSEISRIRVIRVEEYAAIIRSRTTIGQFSQRFHALRDGIQKASQSLDSLRDAANPANPQAIADALAQARSAHQSSADLLDQLARDFHAFELEKRLGDTARKIAGTLRTNLDDLQSLQPDTPPAGLNQAIDSMLERLGRSKPEADELEEDANSVNDSASILEMAAAFRHIVESQRSLAKRIAAIIEQLRGGETQNVRQLPLLAETQTKNRTNLDEFQNSLRRHIDQLSPQAAERIQPLVDSANSFLNDLKAADPAAMMDAASRSAGEEKADEAFQHADRARTTLEELLAKTGTFPEAARGKAPSFDSPDPDVAKTLDQWLQSLLARQTGGDAGENPGGNQGGPGVAGRGDGQGGWPGGGYSADLPVIGPERLQFQSDSTARSSGGGDQGASQPPPPLPRQAEHSAVQSTQTIQPSTRAEASRESIPESYRDAVRRFLSDPDAR